MIDRLQSARSGRISDCSAALSLVCALQLKPHPLVRVNAPSSIRSAMCRSSAGVVVHLHDTHGEQTDQLSDHQVRLICTQTVREVTDLHTNKPLVVKQTNRGAEIIAPRFVLHTALLLNGI